MKPTVYSPLFTLVVLAACSNNTAPSGPGTTPPAHTTYSVAGDSATVAGKLNDFRTALGGVLNGVGAPTDSGRREINWDGVPAAVTNVDTFPLNFFNVNSKRGAVYATTGTGLRVDSTAFSAIKADLAAQFKPFSGKKLFMAVGSNEVTVDFNLAGTNTPGVVKGFGVIFSDVDKAGSSRVEFFDKNGTLLANIAAPAQAGAQQFSFLGVTFDSALVASVRITSGEALIDDHNEDVSAGGSKDLVVMDDFVYGEPLPQ